MIIFGTRTRTKLIAMLTLLCGRCGNPAAHQVTKRVTWFTLFFLPVFPVRPAKYATLCTFCGESSRVDRETAERLLAQSADGGAQEPSTPALEVDGGDAAHRGA